MTNQRSPFQASQRPSTTTEQLRAYRQHYQKALAVHTTNISANLGGTTIAILSPWFEAFPVPLPRALLPRFPIQSFPARALVQHNSDPSHTSTIGNPHPPIPDFRIPTPHLAVATQQSNQPHIMPSKKGKKRQVTAPTGPRKRQEPPPPCRTNCSCPRCLGADDGNDSDGSDVSDTSMVTAPPPSPPVLLPAFANAITNKTLALHHVFQALIRLAPDNRTTATGWMYHI